MVDAKRKRTAAVKKKSTIKKTAAAKTTSKTPATKLANKSVAKPTTKNKSAKGRTVVRKPRAAKTKAGEVVQLPTAMSLRAVEKTAVLEREFDYFYRDAMYKIAYASGLCFLLVGIAYTTLGEVGTAHNQKALLVDSVISTTLSTENSAPVITSSEFAFITTIPKNVTEPKQVSFEVTNATEVAAHVVPLGQFNGYAVTPKKVSGDKYSLTIPGPDTIQAGYYSLRILVKAANGDTYTRRSTEFFMGSKNIEDWYNRPAPKETEKDSEPETESENSTVTLDDTVATATTSVTEIIPETKPDPITPAPVEESFYLTIAEPTSQTLSDTAFLTVRSSEQLSFIELYARSQNSTIPTFVALGTARPDRWFFQFDTTNLPNGEYAFFAQTKLAGKNVVSPAVRLQVKNQLIPAPEPDSLPTTVERPLVTIADIPETEEPLFLNYDVDAETVAIIKDNETNLDLLLKRYATAKQAGDETILREAEAALAEEQKNIAIKTASHVRTKDISDSIEAVMAEKLTDLQDRIDTFESLRRDRSSGKTATDTDGDGISDIDEATLYNTDPNKADTDGDGFLDGIEIMRGYNPADAAPEAVITFESPKDSIGLVRDDILSVVAEAVVVAGENPASTTLSTELRGTALPNSYVTLYIFSSPTVVTVRTDADGMFVYTFDKELEDGRHDVYVAVTDNAGEIIAQSNPFSFIKEAQAFTPVDAAESDTVTPTPIALEARETGYNVAVGIGFLAFGIILFMLGISLRKNDEADITITETTTTSKDSETL